MALAKRDDDFTPTYDFAVDFFSGREEQFLKILGICGHTIGDKIRILEIGSFEGRSACWFSDNVLDHPQSDLICVDTFRGGDEHQKFLQTEHPDALNEFLGKVDLEATFWRNVMKSKNGTKVFSYKGESRHILGTLNGKFDLIYIDGSHHSEDALLDGVNAWHLLNEGGAMVFDDYQAACFGDRMDVDMFPVQRAADFVQTFFSMEEIHTGSMRALRKVPGAYPPRDVPMALARRANELHSEQRDDEAMECLDKALRIEPDFIGAQFQKGVIALSHGDYKTGWPLFELRRQRTDASLSGVRYQEYPAWNGEPTDKRVVLWAEEGLGDTIQMLRYVPAAIEKCPNLVLEVQPSLLNLCRMNFNCEIVPVMGAGSFDLQCSLLSPPGGPEPIPPPASMYAPMMLERTPQRIGLCWYGNPSHARDRARSIPLPLLEGLAEEFDFLSLQEQDLKPEDVSATAAVIDQLDLVVTVDTMVAHLAGTLGKPVWILLPVDCDWRWLQGRNDSPWYPSARLFRQRKAGDWAPVLKDVADLLREFHDLTLFGKLR